MTSKPPFKEVKTSRTPNLYFPMILCTSHENGQKFKGWNCRKEKSHRPSPRRSSPCTTFLFLPHVSVKRILTTWKTSYICTCYLYLNTQPTPIVTSQVTRETGLRMLNTNTNVISSLYWSLSMLFTPFYNSSTTLVCQVTKTPLLASHNYFISIWVIRHS